MITINLLPASIKSSREYAKKNRVLLKAMTYYSGMLLILYVILLGVLGTVTIDKNNLEEEIEAKQGTIAQYAELEKDADALTKRLDTVNRIFALRPNWKRVIEDIANRRPAGVTVGRITMDAKTGAKVTVQASGSIHALGQYRNALENSPYFDFVDFLNLTPIGGGYTTTFNFELSKGALE